MNYTQAPYDPRADQPRTFGRLRSPDWQQFRAERIKEHPFCMVCGGTELLEAHHYKPYHLYPVLELVTKNIRILCEKPGRCCHFATGHFWNWKTYNPNLDRLAMYIQRYARKAESR